MNKTAGIALCLLLSIIASSVSIEAGSRTTKKSTKTITKKKPASSIKKNTQKPNVKYKYTKLLIYNYTKKAIHITVNYFKNKIHLTKESVILRKKYKTVSVDNGSGVNISYIHKGKRETRIVKAKGRRMRVYLRP
jgi:archaellin